MRIDELATPMDKKLPFDVVDDVAIFMRNDPMFYRKSLFPAVMKMKDRHDSGKECNANDCLGDCCDKAMKMYCNKFKLGSPGNIFRSEDKDLLIKKVFGEEMKMIKDGAY
tara:strand:- start:438 stop:767 length:330 start_codon:yes stop_codon:yes gene_type:complete